LTARSTGKIREKQKSKSKMKIKIRKRSKRKSESKRRIPRGRALAQDQSYS